MTICRSFPRATTARKTCRSMKRSCRPRRHDSRFLQVPFSVRVEAPAGASTRTLNGPGLFNTTPRSAYMRLKLLAAFAAAALLPAVSQAACCYFSAKNADILQPAQKVFITWDSTEKVETFTVQPKFEGNALDFGMVIPTPTQPKLHE